MILTAINEKLFITIKLGKQYYRIFWIMVYYCSENLTAIWESPCFYDLCKLVNLLFYLKPIIWNDALSTLLT